MVWQIDNMLLSSVLGKNRGKLFRLFSATAAAEQHSTARLQIINTLVSPHIIINTQLFTWLKETKNLLPLHSYPTSFSVVHWAIFYMVGLLLLLLECEIVKIHSENESSHPENFASISPWESNKTHRWKRWKFCCFRNGIHANSDRPTMFTIWSPYD